MVYNTERITDVRFNVKDK